MNGRMPTRSLALAMSGGLLLQSAVAATASPSGHRNTAVVLGAAAAGTAMNGQVQVAPILGAGALVAYGRYRLALRQQQRRREREARVREWLKENHQWLKENHRLPRDWRRGRAPSESPPAPAARRKRSILDRLSRG
jgi:hypothetical protein